MVADAVMLSKAAVEGKLETRADASKHQGDYRKIVQGCERHTGRRHWTPQRCRQIRGRNLEGAIRRDHNTYQGEFNTIKNNLNTLIVAHE